MQKEITVMTEKYKQKQIDEQPVSDWWDKAESEKNGKTDSNTEVRQSDRDTVQS